MAAFLDEEAFIQLFAREMELPEDLALGLDSRLVEDLGFDSLQMMLAVELISELVGEASAPEDELEIIEALGTLRSVYSYYVTKFSAPQQEQVADPDAPGALRLRGSLVELKPPGGEHYGRLYEIAISTEVAWRWRYGGAVPSYDEFIRTFDTGVLTQLVVTRPRSNEPVGLVVAYNANPMKKHAYLAAVVEPRLIGSGAGAEAVTLFLGYVFGAWDFEKLYLELPEFNLAQFESGLDRYIRQEGRLRSHIYHAGKRWDQLVLAIYRDELMNRRKLGPVGS